MLGSLLNPKANIFVPKADPVDTVVLAGDKEPKKRRTISYMRSQKLKTDVWSSDELLCSYSCTSSKCSCPPMFGFNVPPEVFGNPFKLEPLCKEQRIHRCNYSKSVDQIGESDFVQNLEKIIGLDLASSRNSKVLNGNSSFNQIPSLFGFESFWSNEYKSGEITKIECDPPCSIWCDSYMGKDTDSGIGSSQEDELPSPVMSPGHSTKASEMASEMPWLPYDCPGSMWKRLPDCRADLKSSRITKRNWDNRRKKFETSKSLQ